ncbi:MAG: Holliday junction resolvase-like protein [Candidatus Woesearchaeota archaeon]
MNEILIILVIAIIFILLSFFIGRAAGKRFMFEVMNHVLEKEKEKALDKSRSVIKGQLLEQFAPFGVDFPCASTECNFQGKPIDFIGFKGLDNKFVEEVLFIEVKSGNSQLSGVQKSVKKAIEEGRVRFVEVRV